MITVQLNDFLAEDMKDIMYLQKLGVPDELIQELYDKEQERRKKLKNDSHGE
jgi:hypothetical protein